MIKKLQKTFIISLLIFGIIVSTSDCIYANEVVKINNNRKFELPSKLHKDGEGFYYIGKMLTPRYHHSAVLLQDGRVFIAGGYKSINQEISNTTEIFDLKTNISIQGPDLDFPTINPILFYLKNGNILIFYSNYSHKKYQLAIYNPNRNIIESKFDFILPYYFINSKNIFVSYINEYEIVIMKNGELAFPFLTKIYYNEKTNSIKITDEKDGTIGNSLKHLYYLIRLNDDFYFTTYPYGQGADNIIKMTLLELNTSLKNFKNSDLNFLVQCNEIAGAKGIVLNNNIVGIGNKKIFLFNPENNEFLKFITFPFKYSDHYIHFVDMLNNDNIIVLIGKYPFNDKILEVNTKSFTLEEKKYNVPASTASIVSIGNNKFLYFGGVKYNSPKQVLNSVYIWKYKE